MKNLLSIDGWYFKMFTKLANLMLLNMIFIVASIPVVTAGISFMALINSLQDLKTDGTLSATRVFIAHFKKNLSKGMILLLIEGLGFLVPGFLIYISLKYIPLLSTLIMIIFSFLLLLLVIFPFSYSLNDFTVKEAFLQTLQFVSLKIAYGIAAFVIPIVIIYFSMKYSVIFLFLIGISLIVYLQLYFMNKGGIVNEND